MTKSWYPNLPIEFLFKKIEDAVAYADHSGAPLSPIQVVNKAYTLVFKTGLFPNNCKDWQHLALPARTWITFKTTFARAHQEWLDTQSQTVGNTYGTTNDLEEDPDTTANAINALATATASGRVTTVSLAAAVATLSAQLEMTQAQLATCQAQIFAKTTGTSTAKKWEKPKNPYWPN